MATYYKPSQWRGKRVVYKSIDPAEPKRETIKAATVFIFIVVLVVTFAWFSSR